jgi:hypothetical protein
MSNLSGKQRASRIPLDYYKHPDRVVRTKRFLTLVLLAVTGVWVVSYFALAGSSTPLSTSRFSHGPVASVHAKFENDCGQCHVNFSFLSGSLDGQEARKLGCSHFAGDKQCMECHLGEGAATHWNSQLVDMTPNCGNCHKDHRGRDADLKRVASKDCANCHKDLKKSMEADQKQTYDNTVTGFPTDHQNFRLLRDKKPDPSRIKFNHKYHMTPGIVLTPGGKPFKVEDIDEKYRAEYAKRLGKDAGAVQLDCKFCHTPAAGLPVSRGLSDKDPAADKSTTAKAFQKGRDERGHFPGTGERKPPQPPGAYMAPINYEQNCAGCHSLRFGPGADLTLDHKEHYQPDKLREVVTTKLIVAPESGPKTLPPFGLPGKPVAARKSPPLAERVEMSMRLLLEGKRTCGECHVSGDGTDLSVLSKSIAKTNIPDIWFQHARFDHSKHSAREIDCRTCHAQAYAIDSKGVLDEAGLLAAYALPRKGAEIVMLPDIDNCRQCHTPKPGPEKQSLAAKSDCTECHTYHHGTPRPEQAALRDRREIEDWLAKRRPK